MILLPLTDVKLLYWHCMNYIKQALGDNFIIYNFDVITVKLHNNNFKMHHRDR